MHQRQLPARKRIALIAHDSKKPELLSWVSQHKAQLEQHELCATGTTGKLIEKELSLPVFRFQSGPLGGDQQIGAAITEGKIDMVVFFWDPLEAQPHDPDVKALLRLAAVWNIPLACNSVTADFLVSSHLFHKDLMREVPDFTSYLERL